MVDGATLEMLCTATYRRFESCPLRQAKPKSNTKVFGLGFSFAKIQVLSAFFGCRYAVVSVFSGFV